MYPEKTTMAILGHPTPPMPSSGNSLSLRKVITPKVYEMNAASIEAEFLQTQLDFPALGPKLKFKQITQRKPN
jgi:hypothetical protein